MWRDIEGYRRGEREQEKRKEEKKKKRKEKRRERRECVRHDFRTRKTGVNGFLREVLEAKAEHMVWGLTGNL